MLLWSDFQTEVVASNNDDMDTANFIAADDNFDILSVAEKLYLACPIKIVKHI